MDSNSSDVVGMSFKLRNLLRGVVVIYSNLEVIGATNNPVFTCDEATSSDGDLCELKRLDGLLSFIGPNIDLT